MTKPKMVAWRDVKATSSVTLRGKRYVVDKIKVKGKVAKVTVSPVPRGISITREVRAKDLVEVPPPISPKLTSNTVKGGPLHDESGAQRRWAKPKELDYDRPESKLPKGDPAQKKAPHKAKGGEWSEPADKAEQTVVETLGARLVGASENEAQGYYVPVVDASTIAAHLFTFHGVEPVPTDYAAQVVLHDAQHAKFKTGAELAVTHWHTKERP